MRWPKSGSFSAAVVAAGLRVCARARSLEAFRRFSDPRDRRVPTPSLRAIVLGAVAFVERGEQGVPEQHLHAAQVVGATVGAGCERTSQRLTSCLPVCSSPKLFGAYR